MYLLVWSPGGGASGGEWVIVALGVVIDVCTYAAKPAQSRYATT